MNDETTVVTRNRTNKFNRKKKFAKNWQRNQKSSHVIPPPE